MWVNQWTQEVGTKCGKKDRLEWAFKETKSTYRLNQFVLVVVQFDHQARMGIGEDNLVNDGEVESLGSANRGMPVSALVALINEKGALL